MTEPINHEYGEDPDRPGRCARLVLLEYGESSLWVAGKNGPVEITDDRSVYVACGEPESEHMEVPF